MPKITVPRSTPDAPGLSGRFFHGLMGEDRPGATMIDDAALRAILMRTKVIALVGYSSNPARPSHQVARYLHAAGYRVIPVNPGLAGQRACDEEVRAGLQDCPEDVDMVDIFRAPDAIEGIVSQALGRWPEWGPGAGAIWMQLGLRHPAAAAAARARGVDVIEDRCTKIEHARLIGRG